MKNELVVSKKNGVFCDSRMVAEKFNKKHAYVIRLVQKLIEDIAVFKGDAGSPLIIEKEGEYRGQKYIYYEMDKKFFTRLSMRFRGEKAFEWQGKFIDAFFQMEDYILTQKNNKSNLEWQQEREQGKAIRLDLTDTIQIFIDYAIKQGGSQKGCGLYYSNVTKMEYKALGFIEINENVCKKFRNTLNTMDLNHLLAAENVAKKAIMEGMSRELHYKDIFAMAKERVIKLADIMVIPKRIERS